MTECKHKYKWVNKTTGREECTACGKVLKEAKKVKDIIGVDLAKSKDVTYIDKLKVKSVSLTPEGVKAEGEIIKSHKKKED